MSGTGDQSINVSRPRGRVCSPSVENAERFVTFAFAAADILVETDASGNVSYAAGAVHSKFGHAAETFIGRPVRELVAPGDHEVLDTALSLLTARGRLPPLMIRMSDPRRTSLALSGLTLAPVAEGLPPRLCLTFTWPPAPLASVLRPSQTPHALARATEARLRAGTRCDLGMIEITGDARAVMSSGEAVAHALETAGANLSGSEIAPGRFGVVGAEGVEPDLLSIANLIEATMRRRGAKVGVATRHLSLAEDGLTSTQIARALRQALNMFAREGARGFDKAGFDGGLTGYVRRATAQTSSLRKAIEDVLFNLVFQPIASITDRAPHHFEALIRPALVPGCGFHGPQEFVMAVEAVGLADQLDLGVARLACEAADKAGVSVAFNLSGQSVQNTGFRDRLTGLLRKHPACKAGLVIVEMTETAEIEDVAEASLTAEALRSLGVPFCLDDFGAGAADIRLLRALNPDIVKLDGSYIPGITQGGREHAFVTGMVEIARAADAEIVAERVETQAEADILGRLGVQYGQGWLFGRPGPLPHSRPSGHGRTYASSLPHCEIPFGRGALKSVFRSPVAKLYEERIRALQEERIRASQPESPSGE
jgi:EAL domain-containing protein (putative c-di-GMP-specific phosphodiesterase class I)